MEYAIYEDALVVPSPSRSAYRDIDGAVFDASLRPLGESLLTRTWRDGQIGIVPSLDGVVCETAPVVEETHIYGGYFFDHFGHFLLESLARSWVVGVVGRFPFVWAAGGSPNAWQAEILALLGINTPQRFPTEPTRFRRLIIATPGFRIQGQFHSRHSRFLGRCRAPPPSPVLRGAKVWLSRTDNHSRGRSGGEEELQAGLERCGWRIIHPQRLGVFEQLQVLAHAEVVAGLEGSAFHAAILLATPAAPFVTFRRTPNRNYAAIAKRNGNLALDLYGAFLIAHRGDLRLHRPRVVAATVQRISEGIKRREHLPRRLTVLKRRYERLCARERWLRRQHQRWYAQGMARLRHSWVTRFFSRLGRRLRRLR